MNSLLLGAISVAYHRIIPEKQRPSQLKIVIPMAYWNKENAKDFQPKNNFMSHTVVFQVSESLEKAAHHANDLMAKRKDPFLLAFIGILLRFITTLLPWSVF